MPRDNIASRSRSLKAARCKEGAHGSQHVNMSILNAAADMCEQIVSQCVPGISKSLFLRVRDSFLAHRFPDAGHSHQMHATQGAMASSHGNSSHQNYPVQAYGSRAGWAIAELCAQCINAIQHGTGEGCCNALQCAFIRAHYEICDLLRVLGPFCNQMLAAADRNYSPNANTVMVLFDEAEQIATDQLWQLSGMIRWVCCCCVPVVLSCVAECVLIWP